MPIGRFVAEELTLAVTLAAGPEGTSVPLSEERLSQDDVLMSDHVSEAGPVLVSEKTMELKLKGPPTGPLLMKPTAGVTCKESGISKASCTPMVVELAGAVALKPRPRFAKAAQSSV